MLGPLIFNMFMNDLVYVVSTLSAYADDTQIVFADSTAEKVEEVINTDLANDKLYEQNGIKRKASKYQAICNGKVTGKTTIFNFTAKTLLFPLPENWKCLVLLYTTKLNSRGT